MEGVLLIEMYIDNNFWKLQIIIYQKELILRLETGWRDHRSKIDYYDTSSFPGLEIPGYGPMAQFFLMLQTKQRAKKYYYPFRKKTLKF